MATASRAGTLVVLIAVEEHRPTLLAEPPVGLAAGGRVVRQHEVMPLRLVASTSRADALVVRIASPVHRPALLAEPPVALRCPCLGNIERQDEHQALAAMAPACRARALVVRVAVPEHRPALLAEPPVGLARPREQVLGLERQRVTPAVAGEHEAPTDLRAFVRSPQLIAGEAQLLWPPDLV